MICSRASYSALTSFSFWLKACTSWRLASRSLFSSTMKSFGVSSSFLRRCTVSASSERTYACRSCSWISYSVSRRRVLESDMEAGRNFEKPSRLGLLFLSNSFIAHPFSLDPSCAVRARARSLLGQYRRRSKRKSRLSGPSAAFVAPTPLGFRSWVARRAALSSRIGPPFQASSVPEVDSRVSPSKRVACIPGSTYNDGDARAGGSSRVCPPRAGVPRVPRRICCPGQEGTARRCRPACPPCSIRGRRSRAPRR